jgi:hypothetical protein
MARLARIVVPDLPHHVTARGNRREPIFFEDGDQEIYLDLLAEQMVTVAPVLDRVERFADFIETDPDDPAFASPRAAETTGRPLGTVDFVAGLERRLGRPIARRAPGRKPAARSDDQPAPL